MTVQIKKTEENNKEQIKKHPIIQMWNDSQSIQTAIKEAKSATIIEEQLGVQFIKPL